ncbi:transcriptional regulator [Arthrobacter globiformis]|uniref:Transcriptional regulator n=1 Tax=Arthrobacter globiformis TaxID=1665 RepID=A0A328HGJ3_ARTGO|nr:transcriptional regulator [Arthrobacter globiformis]RAM37261.1 transcriptional regulator [Arthrobacter globiformis]
MKLTAQIGTAADGRLNLRVLELPELKTHARRVDEIPDAVRDAAAKLTGRPKDDFDIEVRY